MNQAIQVLDGYAFVDDLSAIKIEVMATGEILPCYISGASKESLAKLYSAKQFEIEELIAQELGMNNMNAKGEIWLTLDAVNAY